MEFLLQMADLEQNISGYIDMKLLKNIWLKKKCEYMEYVRFGRMNVYLKNKYKKNKIIGITRIRNEELIIKDTLKHIEPFVDGIIVLDDNSQDQTEKIVKENEKVFEILKHKKWNQDRVFEETEHRKILLNIAKTYNPEWIFYFDADERFEINKEEILNLSTEIDGIRIRLFDAYITAEDQKEYEIGQPLWNFRKMFGQECRDILMIFRNTSYIRFEGLDAREPVGCKNIINKFYCQHYGKAVSIEQWEETCEYYAENFPEPYKTKWELRKGKAVHSVSDFETPLFMWEDVKNNFKKI